MWPSVVVTSFSKVGADRYGYRMVASAAKFWPLPVVVYMDDDVAWEDPSCPGASVVNTTESTPGWVETQDRLPVRREGATKPDNYIWNARRYAVKPFVWLDVAERNGRGIVIWLDGDTVTTQPVPALVGDVLLGDADAAYMGRGPMHPETGCVVFRIPEALPLLRWCRDAYQFGAFAEWLDGWTDCHALRAGLSATAVRARDLTSHLHGGPWNSRVDAFALSPLGPYVTHLKGTRRKQEALCAT